MKKRLVICCDGTWNRPDQMDRGKVCPTNVVKTALAVAEKDPAGYPQLVYYDQGVGTGRLEYLRGGAFGYGLAANIREAYAWLVDHYWPDDELFFFGFSRGAYTARSVAGFIRCCGLLKRRHAKRLDEAYVLYRRRDSASHPRGIEAQIFRRMHAHEPRIKFVGVWDTVGALGIPLGPLRVFNQRVKFHDVKLSSYVENAFQALAIDERRPFFQPAIWERQEHAQDQVLEQAWFAGVHSNVGGGYADTGLSDLAFLWMKGKAESCGLAFRDDDIHANVHPNPAGALRDSKTGIYRLFPDHLRPIGTVQGGGEAVHKSAVERRESARDPAYRPRNLHEYLERGGRVAN